ncbi:MAG: ribbon-helix-helix protein, CopG family [Gammaproteobacteria bacterium]|nr:ribbon-helix-helix protein, CopG family [Gammaproteobacteria bacterium]
MIFVRLPKELEMQLEKIVNKTHRSKSYYIRKALEQFLEDHEDYLSVVARLEENNLRISYEKIRKELGLDRGGTSSPNPSR